eukprot:4709042-Pleurochrysis_carterae.AAC.11
MRKGRTRICTSELVTDFLRTRVTGGHGSCTMVMSELPSVSRAGTRPGLEARSQAADGTTSRATSRRALTHRREEQHPARLLRRRIVLTGRIVLILIPTVRLRPMRRRDAGDTEALVRVDWPGDSRLGVAGIPSRVGGGEA